LTPHTTASQSQAVTYLPSKPPENVFQRPVTAHFIADALVALMWRIFGAAHARDVISKIVKLVNKRHSMAEAIFPPQAR
jgi:hypothetical protein